MIQHNDDIGVFDGGQAVGDDEHRPAVHQGVHALLDDGLRAGVDGGGGLVQDHHRRVRHGGPGDGQQLPLALAQVGAVLRQHGLVALRQTGDEVVGPSQLRGGDTLLVGSLQVAIADILHNCAGEEDGILEHDAQGPAQVALADLADVDAVVADLAVGDVVKAVEEVGDGGFARAGGPHEGHLLAGLGVQGDVVEHRLARHILKVHVEQPHIAGQLGVGDGAVGLVGVLPGPGPGPLLTLHKLTVLFGGVDKSDIALVLLGLLIHQLEDPLRAGQTHHHGVDLVGHLADVAHELAGHVQEGNGDADGHGHAGETDVGGSGEQQQAAGEGHQHVQHVADVVEDGHEDVGVAVGPLGLGEQGVVDGVKGRLGLLLVAENLDNLLAAHHLLHKALQLA